MSPVVEITNTSSALPAALKVSICNTFATKLRGLMFTPSIDPEAGLLFVEPGDSKINSSIHMFFMNYDIAVIWMNRELEVVDLILAKKWHAAYVPARPASYTLELHPSRLADFHLDDKISLKNA